MTFQKPGRPAGARLSVFGSMQKRDLRGPETGVQQGMTRTLNVDPAGPLDLLRACPAYIATSLARTAIAGRDVWVKDETHRMRLGAFKALGGVYAVARLIEAGLGQQIAPEDFVSEDTKTAASAMTFVCASAGNHGMSVAAGAQLFGVQARIYLAETVDEAFAERLRGRGAEVVRAGETYEESVAAAVDDAARTGAIHLADGSWPGYTEPPSLVMEGYTIIAEEMRDTLRDACTWPDHVYLQAGVGGFAAAIAEMIRRNWDVQPKITVVEPEAAACLKASVAVGEVCTVEGPVSDMGRLDCKTPSMLAFESLRQTANAFETVSEEEAQAAVQAAAEAGFGTTPSGAAGLAAALRGSAKSPLVILSEGAVDAG